GRLRGASNPREGGCMALGEAHCASPARRCRSGHGGTLCREIRMRPVAFRFHLASGSGLNWILIAFGRFSFPPSRWKFTRDPEVVHSPLPFHPAFSSSILPSTFFG